MARFMRAIQFHAAENWMARTSRAMTKRDTPYIQTATITGVATRITSTDSGNPSFQ